jgi:hypothetical protein
MKDPNHITNTDPLATRQKEGGSAGVRNQASRRGFLQVAGLGAAAFAVHPRRTLVFQFRAADAFPIWYGPMTAKGEAIYRPIRGRIARFARFDGPRPLVPYGGNYTSLFELQAQSKAAMARVQT